MKYYPASLPYPLQAGYTTRHTPNILRTEMSDGYSRQRLVNQGAPDTVQCSVLLDESQYKTFLTWYKGEIHCGADWYVMPLLATEGDTATAYRYARIQRGEVSAAVVTTSPSRGTIYRLTMTLDVSNTVVDDGTWVDYYTSGNTGEAYGTVSTVEDAVSSGVSEVIEEDTDTGAGIGTASTAESASTYDEV